jgi:ATP-dependent RNA helicase DeaD
MESFKALGLDEGLLKVAEELGFKEPSEIQKKAIPLALQGKDIIGGSATGSGKTFAFAAPIIQKLNPEKKVQALVLTPTRELAEQISTAFKRFSRHKKLKVLPVYGGVSISGQLNHLSVSDILVGTPGRILDHLSRGSLNLSELKFLVLDEVDRMFDMGFYSDVEKILNACPKKRQTMLFSATISSDLDHLASKHTSNAVEVEVESYVDHSKLKQIYYDVENNLKFSLLVHLLKQDERELVMVFCSTRRNADFVHKNLKNARIPCGVIHGGFTQNKRTKVLDDFHHHKINVLICTDVAARGLDIKGVSHVYNYDIPKTSDEYIHRIGRTARAGKNGMAVNILSNRDYENFSKVMEDESLKIDLQELPRFERLRFATDFHNNFSNKRNNFPSRRRNYSRKY